MLYCYRSTELDVKDTLRKMRIGKSVGHGDMPIEVWKSEKDQQWKLCIFLGV